MYQGRNSARFPVGTGGVPPRTWVWVTSNRFPSPDSSTTLLRSIPMASRRTCKPQSISLVDLIGGERDEGGGELGELLLEELGLLEGDHRCWHQADPPPRMDETNVV